MLYRVYVHSSMCKYVYIHYNSECVYTDYLCFLYLSHALREDSGEHRPSGDDLREMNQ
jgi:hypothetical protein